ncbi:C-C motif chemokine 17-like [Amblyraja radiata]|uniref:C-C motif chemokine 17-like n=1 Tax=Amblyraja radiata TaxID=386614 RepID=UPI001401FA27|nr:C-C motif chemokine 17-like [Amblyraja radiata]
MKQVFVVLICLGVVNFNVAGAPTRVLTSCCMRYSTRIPVFKNIQRYEMQAINGQCRIEAVIFFVRGKRVCSDPKNEKVIENLRKLIEKEQRMKMMLILWK